MLSKKPSNNSYSNIKSPTPLLILIPMILSLHGKDIKEQTSEIFPGLFMSHSLLIRKIIKERPRWRYLRNKKTIKIPFLVGPFIFSNLLILPIHFPRALPLFPVKTKEHFKETSSLVLLLKQTKPPLNIFPFFKMLKMMKTLPIMVNQA